MSLVMRDTIKATLFIGTVHVRTLKPLVKAGELQVAYNQRLKEVSATGTWL